MNIREMPKDELELLSFTDIAYHIIKLDNEPKATAPLFKEICLLLDLSMNQYEEKITDFFASMTTDKRFILLDNGTWDFKNNHMVNLKPFKIDDDDDDDLDELEDLSEEYEKIEEEDDDDDEIDDDEIDDDLENLDDEYEGLEIIEEDDEI
ncbi:MAG: DNA-directed RNA polymerase subunit delta [Bacilli bacterium]|nr:DNA-directed RNA polymerase subunit delta [Bacilli bacterium]